MALRGNVTGGLEHHRLLLNPLSLALASSFNVGLVGAASSFTPLATERSVSLLPFLNSDRCGLKAGLVGSSLVAGGGSILAPSTAPKSDIHCLRGTARLPEIVSLGNSATTLAGWTLCTTNASIADL